MCDSENDIRDLIDLLKASGHSDDYIERFIAYSYGAAGRDKLAYENARKLGIAVNFLEFDSNLDEIACEYEQLTKKYLEYHKKYNEKRRFIEGWRNKTKRENEQ